MKRKTNCTDWTLLLATLAFLIALIAILAIGRRTEGDANTKKADAPTATQQAEIKLMAQAEASPPPVLTSTEPVALTAESAPPAETSPAVVPRYESVRMTDAELEELAAIVWLEAGNQCAEGQQAVAEVVLNRVISPDFPNTVHEVLHQRGQFSTARNIRQARAGQTQYSAIGAALCGPSILPEDVVFFSTRGENSRVWGKIEDHVFCFGYTWDDGKAEQ